MLLERLLTTTALVTLVASTSLANVAVVSTPVWFNEMMIEKNCTFTKVLYNEGKCDVRMFFNGEFPFYMQVIGLGLNEKLEPDTSEFADSICRCGVLEVRGACTAPMLRVLSSLRKQCGPENIYSLPDLSLTLQQWLDRERPRYYKTVTISRPRDQLEEEFEMVSSSLEILSREMITAATTVKQELQEDPDYYDKQAGNYF
ncbi:uncharacterized protein LOC108683016 [Hyalella azteca]|uniref:Uncharacterized protein LOC108683016 n=1 Tax=Hyalella azteca TaxID=294128 RepID=A0A8B7PNK0_HYAAZ|nr:uncharacterized protein LOC108683016 [Hyalella azteca]